MTGDDTSGQQTTDQMVQSVADRVKEMNQESMQLMFQSFQADMMAKFGEMLAGSARAQQQQQSVEQVPENALPQVPVQQETNLETASVQGGGDLSGQRTQGAGPGSGHGRPGQGPGTLPHPPGVSGDGSGTQLGGPGAGLSSSGPGSAMPPQHGDESRTLIGSQMSMGINNALIKSRLNCSSSGALMGKFFKIDQVNSSWSHFKDNFK